MPTPVILDMLTFLWPSIGVNILERNSVNSHPLWPCQPHRQICRGRSRGPPHSPPEWWWLKKSWLCHHRISPAHMLSCHCKGPTVDFLVLIWQPCDEKNSLQIQRCSSSTEKYDTRKVILIFLHIGRQSRSSGGAWGDGCWRTSRCERGRRREREVL